MTSRLIGDRRFYSRVLAIALPMIVQNAITNFVSMLDNLMVGQLTTAEIAGVNIVNNNLIFIFNLCLFGAAAGAGIFTTQFYGSGDHAGVRYTFRFKLYSCVLLSIGGIALFLLVPEPLINLYLKGDGDPLLAEQTLKSAKDYLFAMLPGLVPFAFTNAYAGTLKVCGKPVPPMIAGLIATFLNLILNYIMIFGHLGCPAMGVKGAAYATVISRFAELFILMLWSHTRPDKLPFMKGLYRSAYIPGAILKNIAIKGMPLLVNEAMWSFGMAFLNQCYSVCSLDVVPALSISSTVFNLAAISFKSLGATVGIITGQALGASRPEAEVRDENRKMTALCLLSGVVFGGLLASISGVFPHLYQTTDSVRSLATGLILISAADVVMQSYIYPVYFTLRAGGRTVLTFIFDCLSIWVLSLPTAFVLCNYTDMPVLAIYGICIGLDLVKCVFGVFMLRSRCWIRNLTVSTR